MSRIGVVAIATATIELRAFLSSAGTSSNYITVCALLEIANRCRTTSSTEFHQTLSFPSSVGKGSGLRDYDGVCSHKLETCYLIVSLCAMYM